SFPTRRRITRLHGERAVKADPMCPRQRVVVKSALDVRFCKGFCFELLSLWRGHIRPAFTFRCSALPSAGQLHGVEHVFTRTKARSAREASMGRARPPWYRSWLLELQLTRCSQFCNV